MEAAPLAERMGYLQALRGGFAIVVLASALFAPEVIGASLTDLVVLSAAYLLLSAGTETLRRKLKTRGLHLVEGLLLVDAAYLAFVMYLTGGTQSPLRFLAYLHLIGVALLASHRTSIKIAVWHGLLFFVGFYAQASGLITSLDPSVTGGEVQQPSVMSVVALILVAVTTTVFSSVNERELRRRKADLEALTDAARRLEDAHEPQEIAELLLGSLTEHFGFSRALILAAPPPEEPQVLAASGTEDLPTSGVDPIVEQAWNEHGAVLTKRLDATNTRLASLLPGATNVMVVPLFAEGSPLGAAIFEAPRKGRLERRILDVTNQFAAHAALALRNAWLLQQVQRMAETDGLTGIPNRRTFEQTIERELSRASRNGEQVTLVMLDIDHFKKLNDTHGHQTGDEVLRRAAAALQRHCRDFDTPARYGGEEFVVVLPSCSAKESLIAAERLRMSICEADTPVPVTASAGVATFPVHAGDAEGLIKTADEALYESKRTGRNRVTRSRREAPPMRRLNVREPNSLVDLPTEDIGG